MSLNLDTPLSLYSIVAAYIIAAYPHRVKYQLINSTIGFDNVRPRNTEAETLLKRGMERELVEKVEKLTGAHRNGNEVFPLWAIAVLAANQAGIPQRTLNIASIVFIMSRLAYNYIYIRQKNEIVAGLRSLVWLVSISKLWRLHSTYQTISIAVVTVVPLYLITISANKLRI